MHSKKQLTNINLIGDLMNIVWQKTIKAALLIIILLLISTLILNIFYYLDIISSNTIKYFKMILSLLSFLIGGIYMGKNSPSKGCLYGLRLSLSMIVIMLILGIIFNNINLSRILYYLIMSVCITFGSMIGINKKIL